MGTPTTKAEIDREIARLEGSLASQKQRLANSKHLQANVHNGTSWKGDIANAKCEIERIKGQIAALKQKRKSAPK